MSCSKRLKSKDGYNHGRDKEANKDDTVCFLSGMQSTRSRGVRRTNLPLT